MAKALLPQRHFHLAAHWENRLPPADEGGAGEPVTLTLKSESLNVLKSSSTRLFPLILLILKP